MKALPLKLESGKYIPCAVQEASHIKMLFPVEFEPLKVRIIPVNQESGWAWNGDVDKPTLHPSILTRLEGVDADGNPKTEICHSYVDKGIAVFLGDCTHSLANQNVDLLDVQKN